MADLRNRRNVLVGAPDVKASGGILVGPVATEASEFPETVDANLTDTLGQLPAGYVNEDGVTKSVDRSTEKIKDWNGDTVLITQSDHSVTLQLTFMESANAEVLKMIAGEDNVQILDDGTIRVVDNADELPHRSISFKIKGGNDSKILVFAPDAQATEVGEVQYVRSNVVAYQVTLECFGVEDVKLVSLIKRGVAGGARDYKVKLPSGVTGGTWKITYNGRTTGDLAQDAQSSAVQSELRKLPGLSAVTVSGGPSQGYTIKGLKTAPKADGKALTGGSSTDITIE